jgi:hypothetical protein
MRAFVTGWSITVLALVATAGCGGSPSPEGTGTGTGTEAGAEAGSIADSSAPSPAPSPDGGDSGGTSAPSDSGGSGSSRDGSGDSDGGPENDGGPTADCPAAPPTSMSPCASAQATCNYEQYHEFCTCGSNLQWTCNIIFAMTTAGDEAVTPRSVHGL